MSESTYHSKRQTLSVTLSVVRIEVEVKPLVIQ